jgi:F-type H+-transporting ATPase subunit delta
VTSSKVATRYARALLELAAEQGQLENWGAELQRLARIVGSPELLPQLTSPQLADQARLEAMTLVGERLDLSFPVRSFALVVARHGRIVDLPAISDAYQGLLDQRLGRARAELIFAMQPSEAQVEAVKAALAQRTGKQIIATVSVDPELLGGVVAEVEGRTYDASLATAMRLLERQLSPQ